MAALIPVGPIVWAIIALARGARRGGRQRVQLDARTGNAVLRGIGATIALAVVLGLIDASPFVGYPIGALLAAALFPAWTLKFVIVPLGLPRVAYYFASASPPVLYTLESRNAAVFFGTLAALRSRRADAKTLDFLESRLATEHCARGVALTAAGLLAAARGKNAAARVLLASVDALRWSTTPGAARRAARCWLVADAARQGDWLRVAELGRGRGSYQRWPYAMAAFAERIAGLPRSLGSGWLWLLWLVAPHRCATLPVLRRALAAPRSRHEAVDVEGEVAAGGPLEIALRLHAACLLAPHGPRIVASARAWDAVRGAPAVDAFLRRRALGLGAAAAVEPMLARILDTAVSDMAPYAGCASLGGDAAGPTLQAVAARARKRDLDDIQAAANVLRERTVRRTAIDSLHEWMAWTSLRLLCERASRGGGVQTRRAAFAMVYVPACNWAVWLFNVRTEKLLANHVFRWLLTEAKVAQDVEAVKLMTKNIANGHGP